MTEFITASTLDAALGALHQHGEAAQILAGGTDVMVQLARRQINPGILVHIEGIAALREITVKDGAVEIGALVSHRTLAEDPVIRENYPGVAYSASTVGGWQTQSIGTIAGNVCNASPAADLIAPLLVHGAVVTCASKARGEHAMPLDEFILGRRKVNREPDELVVGIRLEARPENSADTYVKVGRRSAMEVAIAGLAMRVTFEQDLETVSDMRIALCAVGPTPSRTRQVEQLFMGKPLSPDLASEAGAALADFASPIDDVRSSAQYRRSVLPRILIKAIRDCRASVSK